MVAIQFVDPMLRPTNDYVLGWPVVTVQIDIGFSPEGLNPDDEITPNFETMLALVDTGAQATFIDETIARGREIRKEQSTNFGNLAVKGVFGALMMIPGLDDAPFQLEVGTMSVVTAQKKIAVVLGREVLHRYRMIYDPPRRDFRLEK